MSENIASSNSNNPQFPDYQNISSEKFNPLDDIAILLNKHIDELFELKFRKELPINMDKQIKLYNLIRESKRSTASNSEIKF